jgi:aldehyde dehydrogenase (NAD+)
VEAGQREILGAVAFGSYIDGGFADDESRLANIDPATGETFTDVGAASARQFDRAIAAARAAYDHGPWPTMSTAARAEMLGRLLDYLEANKAPLLDLIVSEGGCPLFGPAIAVQFDIPIRHSRAAIDLFRTLPDFVDNPVPIDQRFLASGAMAQSLTRFVPLGVVAAISAYNFPMFLNMWKIIPALIAGNAVILRPSPLTPISSLMLGRAAEAAGLPPGVLNILVEEGPAGARLLTTDPRVDMVSFTGSTDVGAQVMAQGAATMKRLQLELGGKSAQIYLPDNADAAVTAATGVCLSHAGQGCVLGTRVFVPQQEKARLMAAMAEQISKIRIGDPRDPQTQMGPVISAAQRDRCDHYVQAAIDAGGRLVHGGKRPAHLDRGFFFEPTLLDLDDNANPAAQDEIFGPVVGVIGYNSVDHAIEMANDTRFGLSGYVYGRDLRQAVAVAGRMRTGTVNINASGLSPYTPSGGWKMSGLGRERGIEGLRMYQQAQSLNISR